ncbi:MAG: energy-coupled thiamine transporter ThiT [Lachnospiraceae bacterium]|nr:energy-coupled thiamine transporter ThiT [Lachnospiraceae bacterium]
MSFFFTAEEYDGVTSYLPTTAGYAVLILVMVAILLIACYFNGKKSARLSTKQLAFSAMAMALAVVTSMIKLFELPMGGSVTLFSMLFVVLIGFWFGPRAGLMTAIAYGFLQLILEPYIIHPMQMMVDYIFAFGALGLSGIFANKKHGLLIGYWVAVCGRFVFAFLSGMIFFGSAAADYNMSIPVYSAVYNGSYLLAEGIMTTIILCIPPVNKALQKVKDMALADRKVKKQATTEE